VTKTLRPSADPQPHDAELHEAESHEAEPQLDELHRLSRRLLWLTLGVVLLAGAGAGAWAWAGNGSWPWTSSAATESSPAAGPVATAVVELGTISATDTWDGTIDHGSPLTVTSNAEGIFTRLVEQGETVGRGDELYRVSEEPVTLLYGEVPMYRDLAIGDSGTDVEQLEENLDELGYDGFTVDGEYTAATADAVRAWLGDIGATESRTLARSAVVFVPGGGRVDNIHVDVGGAAAPGVAVLDITGTEQVASLEVDVNDRNSFDVGTEVTVALPGGDEVGGTVTTMAVVDVPSGEGGQEEFESIAQVEITLDEEVPDDLVGASAEVIVAIDERADVLIVPINALLALSEGGYGLEVVDDGTTSIVAVTTGLFADGMVQIEGDEIAAGTVVGVAGR
jgi:peptidoglycan hydrolase-like protein with peptidoglycan-binding domain